MKIKRDFVTNSSSSSFVLMTRGIGVFPLFFCNTSKTIPGNIGWSEQKEMERKNIKNELKRYFGDLLVPANEDWRYNYRWTLAELENDAKYMTDDEGEDILVSFTNVYKNSFNDLRTVLTFSIETPAIYGYEEDERPHKTLERYLKKIVKHHPDLGKEKPCYMNVSTHVKVFTGDGWDGGDPMGEYSFSADCIAKETTMGRMFIKDGNIIRDLKVLENNQDIIVDVINKMNDIGKKK